MLSDPAKAHEIGRILPISVEAVAASSKQLKLERAKWGGVRQDDTSE